MSCENKNPDNRKYIYIYKRNKYYRSIGGKITLDGCSNLQRSKREKGGLIVMITRQNGLKLRGLYRGLLAKF